ncbi:glycosyltransferase family 92 protein RCOM_0530710-like [Nymphaea colorata]|nr:glycosyltransferase family 92 protein RCOM_0530710-like [Nymphaea colorata]
MEEHRQKKKRVFSLLKRDHQPPPKRPRKPPALSWAALLLLWVTLLLLCPQIPSIASLFKVSFRPVLILPWHYFRSPSSSLSSSAAVAIGPATSPIQIDGRVLFPDHVLFLLLRRRTSRLPRNLTCVYRNPETRFTLPPISSDSDTRLRFVRCPLPPHNLTDTEITLDNEGNRQPAVSVPSPRLPPLLSWDSVVYESLVDSDTIVLFVKGLNLRPGRESDPRRLRCVFRHKRSQVTTRAISAAQEIVRCPLPSIFKWGPLKKGPPPGLVVSVTAAYQTSRTIPSAANVRHYPYLDRGLLTKKKKHTLCSCTMVWNQAHFLKEWITYHSRLGVEKWFIYDNNSDDHTPDVLDGLARPPASLELSRHVWPWIKTQEAGFSHCALMARAECEWVAFMDVDEFFYFTPSTFAHSKKKPVLHALLANVSTVLPRVAEIRTDCYSFGPSGLRAMPPRGVMAGYTCRLGAPERHKSIVRPDSLDHTLINVVHHFHLNTGFEYVNLPRNVGVINHYKYQVWEVFKTKFYRRVATYVADWHENQNQGSKDRVPGLGTEAIEPVDWHLQFCEVNDTGLRDFIYGTFLHNGLFPWEKM